MFTYYGGHFVNSNLRSYVLFFIQNAQAPAPGYAPVAGNTFDL